jgi:hypothetical protein
MPRNTSVSSMSDVSQDDEGSILGGSPKTEMRRTSSFWSSMSLPRSRSDSGMSKESGIDRALPYYEYFERENDSEAHRELLASLGWKD